MPYIYKYVNKDTDDVEYVGIITSENNFPNRFIQHKSDGWYEPNKYKIYYKQLKTKTDAEALEGHFIAFYQSYKFHNKAKSKWGECSFAPDIEWNEFDESIANIKPIDSVARFLGLNPDDDNFKQNYINMLVALAERANKSHEEARLQRIEERQKKIEKLLSKEQEDAQISEYQIIFVKMFLDHNTQKASGEKTKRNDLFCHYAAFCATNEAIKSKDCLGKNQFYKMMRKLGYRDSRDGLGAYFWDIKIKEADNEL